MRKRLLVAALFGVMLLSCPASGQTPPSSSAENVALQAEVAFWNSIKDEKDAALFRAYLERYPDGTFAPIAKSRIAAFERQGATIAPSGVPASQAPPPVLRMSEQHFRVLRGELTVSADGVSQVGKNPKDSFQIAATALRQTARQGDSVSFTTTERTFVVQCTGRRSAIDARNVFDAAEVLVALNDSPGALEPYVDYRANHEQGLHVCEGTLRITNDGLSFTSDKHEFTFSRTEVQITLGQIGALQETEWQVVDRAKSKTHFSVRSVAGPGHSFNEIRAQLIRRWGSPQRVHALGSENDSFVW